MAQSQQQQTQPQARIVLEVREVIASGRIGKVRSLTLSTYRNTHAKGVTDKDFALATKIEDVVQWQPGAEGGALEGTPATDQRFAYIKYD